MTYHQCEECGGDGGWTYEDGTKQNCPECHGWGHVDDGEVNEDYRHELDDRSGGF